MDMKTEHVWTWVTEEFPRKQIRQRVINVLEYKKSPNMYCCNVISKFHVCRIQKFNMKCEIERMEIIYTFYFFAFFEKVIKKLLTFCYW